MVHSPLDLKAILISHGLAQRLRITHFLRLLSVTMHSTSSKRQFVHGAPCSTTLHLTFRALQHWQALEARRFTGLPLADVEVPLAVLVGSLGSGVAEPRSERLGEKLSSAMAVVKSLSLFMSAKPHR
jgi:hypothetical protein